MVIRRAGSRINILKATNRITMKYIRNYWFLTKTLWFQIPLYRNGNQCKRQNAVFCKFIISWFYSSEAIERYFIVPIIDYSCSDGEIIVIACGVIATVLVNVNFVLSVPIQLLSLCDERPSSQITLYTQRNILPHSHSENRLRRQSTAIKKGKKKKKKKEKETRK